MEDMRHELPSWQRYASYVIHAPVLSPLAHIATRTILRPRGLLIGSLLAAIILVATYLFARLHGYTPSGSEPLIGFVCGWAIGICYDIASLLLYRLKR